MLLAIISLSVGLQIGNLENKFVNFTPFNIFKEADLDI